MPKPSTPLAYGSHWAGSRVRSRTVGYEGIRTFSVSVLNRVFTLFGFSPQLALINEARLINAQAQDYDRSRAELRFVRQFRVAMRVCGKCNV